MYHLNGLLGNQHAKQQAAALNGDLSSLISHLKLILLEIKTQVSLGGESRTGKETINFGVSGPLLTPDGSELLAQSWLFFVSCLRVFFPSVSVHCSCQ